MLHAYDYEAQKWETGERARQLLITQHAKDIVSLGEHGYRLRMGLTPPQARKRIKELRAAVQSLRVMGMTGPPSLEG